MSKGLSMTSLCTSTMVLASTAANAALIDRGGGLIYDSDQDLTWVQNATLSGRVNWNEAAAWADSLEFGGLTDWRLPTTTQFDDPTCSEDVRGDFFFESRLGCLGGEMELLSASHDPWNNDLFKDAAGNRLLNRTRYWADTPYRDGIDPCINYPNYDVPCTLAGDDGDRSGFYWQFGFTGWGGIDGPSYKTTLSGSNDRYAWAVRDGDVLLSELSGTIKTAAGTDICAMVLASGKFMFSCNPPGVFSLTNLRLEGDGTAKRQIYAHGFFPKIDILTEGTDDSVVMTRSGTCPSYNTPYEPGVFPDSAGQRITITGKVLQQNSETPVCAMVLANGQYMFSCDGTGSYTLDIPLDFYGQFKLQVYADGFAPTIQTFDEFQASNDVRMARATECQ